MDLTPYTDNLRDELMAVAAPGESAVVAERLVATVTSAAKLTMLDLLAAAADEITRDLVGGSVEVRFHERRPYFVVTPPPGWADGEPDEHWDGGWNAADEPAAEDEGTSARINFRPTATLKRRIEDAAAKEGMSVNAWLSRAASAVLGGRGAKVAPSGPDNDRTRRFQGWVG